MSKVGVFLWAWEGTDKLSEQTFKVFDRVKEIGFDSVEIPLLDPMEQKPAFISKMRQYLNKIGLDYTCAAGLGKDENIIDDDKSIRDKGRILFERYLDLCSDLGSKLVSGVLYAFEISKGRGRTQAEWDRAVDTLGAMGDYAKKKGVTIGLEVINRYETYFLNTAADGVDLVRAIGRDTVKVHLDTYHMNIEEKNFYDPIKACKGYLGYIHCCENDRGAPGTGHVNWDEVFRALKEIDYRGYLTIETFAGNMKAAPIATSVWRKYEKTTEEVVIKGLSFLRSKTKQYGL